MTSLSPHLVERMMRARLRPRWARPQGGIGDRTSTAPGHGVEFLDHRPYLEGDDLRHIDTHAYRRFGEAHVKRFAAERRLDVTILLDRSPSMAFGAPSKATMASALAGGLACATLAGGDRLQVATFGGDGVRWASPVTGTGGLRKVLSWMAADHGHDMPIDHAAVGRQVRDRVPRGGLLVLLSDMWSGDPVASVRAFVRPNTELVIVHVLSAEEEDPQLEFGSMELEDSETAERIAVAVDERALSEYARAFAGWRDAIRTTVAKEGGWYLPVRTDHDAEHVLLGEWRRIGLLS